MQISKSLLYIGIWTSILPYLGFPSFIKNILFVLTGISIIYLSFMVRKAFKKETPIKKIFENFSENLNFMDRN